MVLNKADLAGIFMYKQYGCMEYSSLAKNFDHFKSCP